MNYSQSITLVPFLLIAVFISGCNTSAPVEHEGRGLAPTIFDSVLNLDEGYVTGLDYIGGIIGGAREVYRWQDGAGYASIYFLCDDVQCLNEALLNISRDIETPFIVHLGNGLQTGVVLDPLRNKHFIYNIQITVYFNGNYKAGGVDKGMWDVGYYFYFDQEQVKDISIPTIVEARLGGEIGSLIMYHNKRIKSDHSSIPTTWELYTGTFGAE